MNFYKLKNGHLEIGSGTSIPDGFIEYTVGQEPQELLEALEAEKVKQEAEQAVAEAKAYLANTDWYYARKAETGEEVPVDVVNKRKEARNKINA